MAEVNILAEAKPKTITLSDGVEYVIPPVNLTTLANIEKTMGFGLGNFAIRLESETMTTMRALVHALLAENYPNITLEEVGNKITLKEIGAISGTISEIMAMT